jgi:hypothetical protein
MSEPAEIAAKLSNRQREAIPYLDHAEARSPYDLKRLGQKGGFTVLEALERRGIVKECGDHLGRMFSPHTAYKYRLTPLGLAVRRHLLENGNG